MASTGPQLPTTGLTKRKRQDDEQDEAGNRRSSSPSGSTKQQRIVAPAIGPTLPPGDLDEIPLEGPDEDKSSSEDDDDYGPALPSTKAGTATERGTDSHEDPAALTIVSQAPPKAQRDDWMLVPPSSDDWSSRVDPTKLKNRKFNTGKGAKAPAADKGDRGVWTETAEEKQARLRREVMGIEEPSQGKDRAVRDPKAEATAAKVREYTEKARGATLYDTHQKSTTKEKEDDPSARPFDREKDIGGGGQINHTQRKEMLKRAGDFGSRFQSAKYL